MKLESAVPVLRSGNYVVSRTFWTRTLGFSLGEEGGTPPRFGIFHREGATVFIDGWHGADPEPSPGWRAYFHTDDVDGLATALRERGVSVDGPRDAIYGMREITLRDPDGNGLCFGQDLDR